jgi:preprotein translocase subunit SecF
MVNRSLNAVLMRSVSTSLVALLPVVSLLVVGSGILGATALEDFALALAAGLFIGSYSSIFVAAPLLAWWKEREPQYRALAERRRRLPEPAGPGAVAVAASAPVSSRVAVAGPDDRSEPVERKPLGIPGPPAVPRTTIQARPRQQRGKKRK